MSGPLAPWLAPVAWPASIVYGLVLHAREAMLARATPWQAPRPVISVGNVTAGGTGKSPMVRWVCEQLRSMGRSPAVVMRGHRGGERSDEVLEHRMEMPSVPVVVGADRREAIERLLASQPGVDAIVLDDGFQHRRVARDFDLVLVDATRPAIDGALLPLGWLREPACALRRADAVVVTRATGIDAALAARIERHHGRVPIAWSNHAWAGLVVWEPSGEVRAPVDRLRGLRVAVWAGIGNRHAFVAQVRAGGAEVVQVPALADHAAYDAASVAQLAADCRAAGATTVVCTAKDWVKIREIEPSCGLTFVRPELRLSMLAGEAALQARLTEALARGDSRRGR